MAYLLIECLDRTETFCLETGCLLNVSIGDASYICPGEFVGMDGCLSAHDIGIGPSDTVITTLSAGFKIPKEECVRLNGWESTYQLNDDRSDVALDREW